MDKFQFQFQFLHHGLTSFAASCCMSSQTRSRSFGMRLHRDVGARDYVITHLIPDSSGGLRVLYACERLGALRALVVLSDYTLPILLTALACLLCV